MVFLFHLELFVFCLFIFRVEIWSCSGAIYKAARVWKDWLFWIWSPTKEQTWFLGYAFGLSTALSIIRLRRRLIERKLLLDPITSPGRWDLRSSQSHLTFTDEAVWECEINALHSSLFRFGFWMKNERLGA
ncbi:hypothetical protein J1N35_033436 [Gossypium stocksii]|uniref:Transmembrane protein n=1 Tax=Gossypium stocksii TaxID=47602 RepID=A0A9D3ZNC5_9ROSI|nr:hypothetical protein J1N35_033436 [Gossypium stocksii]